MPTDRRFLALPRADRIPDLALLCLAFAAWFGLCYGGAAALAGSIPWRVDVQLPVDARLPFWPAAAALYLAITPLLLLAPFVLRDVASLLPLFGALMVETTIGAAVFLLLPVDDAPVACEAQSAACALFRAADTLNLHHNNLPSLHVAFVCTLALAFARRASGIGAALLCAGALLVCASTLLTHQHFILDVVAGMLLAVLGWRCRLAWAGRPGVAAGVEVELLVLRNFARFARRHRRYLVIGLAILSSGIPRWRRHRLARVGFAFLQAVDDLLDGDRHSDREPLEVADELLASLDSGEFPGHELGRLGESFRAELLARGGRPALEQALALVRAMRNDRRRVLAREVATREQLRDIHRATFGHSIDLMMLAAGSPLRHASMPAFIDALGWCSTVRDLREDLGQGLINVPLDVFAAATAERPEAALPALVDTRAVRDWLARERVTAAGLLDQADRELQALRGQRGARVLVRFARSMRKYLR